MFRAQNGETRQRKLLTAKDVQYAKPGEREYYLRDIKAVGLELRVYPTGRRSWQLRWSRGSKTYVKRLGSPDFPGTKDHPNPDFLSLEQARGRAWEVRLGLQNGAPAPKATAPAIQPSVTLAQATESCVEAALHRRKNKGAEVLRAIQKDVLPALGEVPLSELRRGQILALLDDVARRAPVLARRLQGDLSALLSWATERDMLPGNPLAGVKLLGRVAAERDRILAPEEIRGIRGLGLAPWAVAACYTLLGTAARVGELSAARWEHIEDGVWTIPETKNGKPHRVYLSPFATRWLDELRGRGDWVLQSTARSTRAIDSKTLAWALREAGAGWRPHDLRRNAVTLMGEAGAAGDVIERCLNHREPNKVRRTYQRQEMIEEQRQGWRVLGEQLEMILG